MRRKDKAFFITLFPLPHGFCAFEIKGRIFKVFEIRLIEKIDLVIFAFADEMMFFVEGGFVKFLAGGGIKDIASKVFVVGQIFRGQNAFEFDRFAEFEIAECAAKAVAEIFIFGLWNTLDYTADTLGGDLVSVVFAFNKNELPLAAILLIKIENSMGGCSRTCERIQHNVATFYICKKKQPF